MATIYRDDFGDIYVVLSNGSNFYATFYGRPQPGARIWRPGHDHETMERIGDLADLDVLLLRETGHVHDIVPALRGKREQPA